MCKTINKHYINGQWRQAPLSEPLYLQNPATGQESAIVMLAKSDMAEEAILAASNAAHSWAQTSLTTRSNYIAKIVEQLKRLKPQLVDAIVDELGCPREFTEPVQVEDPIDAFEQHIQWTKDIARETQVDERLLVRKEAIGVCSIITPWNYPLHQLVAKVAPALAAGCTMVVKPSELTPTNAILLAEAIACAELPAGVFNLVIGTGREIGSILTTHPDIDCISFTGSTAVGKQILISSATTLKRVLLELGGKSPFVIAPTDNLEQAVKLGVEDVMANSGQTCVALSRMLVHQSQYEQALKIAADHAKSLIYGCPNSASSFLGPVVNRIQYDRVRAAISAAAEQGAQILCGNENLDDTAKNTLAANLQSGFFISPTIIADVTNDMDVVQQEIFGPVLCIQAYESLEQAITMANDTPYGLSARVWHDDVEQAKTLAAQIKAGQVYINDAFWHNYAPFGGFKQSGNGRELGPDAINEFLEIKSVIL